MACAGTWWGRDGKRLCGLAPALAPRDAMGRLLMAATQSLDVKDARSFEVAVSEPFPLVREGLGKPNAPVPFMLPERLARAGRPAVDRGGRQRPVRVPAGPVEGGRPHAARQEPTLRAAPGAARLPGRRQDRADRWAQSPGVARSGHGLLGLITGEIDYQQYLPFDMIDRLEKAGGVSLLGLGGLHMFQGNFRLKHRSEERRVGK